MSTQRFFIYTLFVVLSGTLYDTANALSPLECGQGITQGLTHLFKHLQIKTIPTGAWNTFMHKTYGNLSELFMAAHMNLSNPTKKFSSPYVEYACTKVDLLSPAFWFVFISCTYLANKALWAGYSCVKRLHGNNKVRRRVIITLDNGERVPGEMCDGEE